MTTKIFYGTTFPGLVIWNETKHQENVEYKQCLWLLANCTYAQQKQRTL